jgi:2-C-methyl-D-erythritol 2,4-cyclodiphosphate synthase
MRIRIGHGHDVHRFAAESGEGKHLVLGGVKIPHTRTLLAHSDGDVLIHALCDAMLGALALGDIGTHFPDTDEQYRGASSLRLLREVRQLLLQQGWTLGNADMTIVAQAPRMAPHMESMRQTLADTLECDIACISIKATTTEGLGYAGRQEGIGCHAVVLLQAP